MSFLFRNYRSVIASLAAAGLLGGCGGDSTGPTTPTGFLAGAGGNNQIGIVVNSVGKSLTLFQLGSPSTQRQIALGTSSTVTPTGLSVRGQRAAVPLGDAASVALIDLSSQMVTRYFTFASGNTTGSAFADDTTIIAANPTLNIVGRMTVGQSSDAISKTSVPLAPYPTDVEIAGNRALIVSANLDANFAPAGNGVVTALDPKTLAVLGTVATGGTNSTAAAVGPDGLLYVVNTGDYVGSSTMTVIDPSSLQVVTNVSDLGPGYGSITIDANGLAYLSSFESGTLVWNTKTRAFVRGPGNPVCAPSAAVGCRTAFGAAAAANGDLYQLFFGDSKHNLGPFAFVYKGGSFALSDSVAVGAGPSAIVIHSF